VFGWPCWRTTSASSKYGANSLLYAILVVYYHACRGEGSWDWLNTVYTYAATFLIPLCGLAALFTQTPGRGYGVVEGVWCDVRFGTEPGRPWFSLNIAFTFAALVIMCVYLGKAIWRLRKPHNDVKVLHNVLSGVGGYVGITLITWIPRRLMLCFRESPAMYGAIHLLPHVSAVLYATLYFKFRHHLLAIERHYAEAASRDANCSKDFDGDLDDRERHDSYAEYPRPIHTENDDDENPAEARQTELQIVQAPREVAL
jgi:hypothetical protein